MSQLMLKRPCVYSKEAVIDVCVIECVCQARSKAISAVGEKRELKSVWRMSVSGGESAREEAGKMAAVAWR